MEVRHVHFNLGQCHRQFGQREKPKHVSAPCPQNYKRRPRNWTPLGRIGEPRKSIRGKEMNITDPIYADEDSYFARANPFSRTPSAFAAFQATTVALRRKLSRHLRQVGTWSDSDRKRTGEALVRAVDSLDLKERTAMRQALHQLLTTVAASGAHRRFGVCQDCTYFGGERCCNPTIASPSLLGVPIQPEDAGLLCVHFQPTSDHHNSGHHE